MTAAIVQLGVLLLYQLQWIKETAAVAIWEKSRRIGASFCTACLAVLTSGVDGAMDTWYIGYNKEMAEEFIRDCGFWAKTFQFVAEVADEYVLKDDDKDILAFRIKFANGKRIVALSSRPTNLRGKQGLVIIDEAAFHGELQELIDAALALLMWGGRVRIISTHFGADNPFNELIEDCRAGKKPYVVHRTTFDEAVEQGLYKRICEVRKISWSEEGEQNWQDEIRAQYADAAAQELDCIPAQAGGTYLSRAVIEHNMAPDIPVLRWSPPEDDFATWSDEKRLAEVQGWLDEYVGPLLAVLPQNFKSYLGEDFGRSGDLTVLWPLQEMENLMLWPPFVVELRNCPFRQQEQVLFYITDRLPRFSGGAFDARGNGQYLAEIAAQRYGEGLIDQVMLSESWYRDNMPRLKARLEDGELALPKDNLILDDLRAFKVVKGVARILDACTTDSKGDKRHGDAGVALAMAVYAVTAIDAAEPFAVATAASSGAHTANHILKGWN